MYVRRLLFRNEVVPCMIDVVRCMQVALQFSMEEIARAGYFPRAERPCTMHKVRTFCGLREGAAPTRESVSDFITDNIDASSRGQILHQILLPFMQITAGCTLLKRTLPSRKLLYRNLLNRTLLNHTLLTQNLLKHIQESAKPHSDKPYSDKPTSGIC